jgi:hypothetical protein
LPRSLNSQLLRHLLLFAYRRILISSLGRR